MPTDSRDGARRREPARRVAPKRAAQPERPASRRERRAEARAAKRQSREERNAAPTPRVAAATVAEVPVPRWARPLFVLAVLAVLGGVAAAALAIAEMGPAWLDEASAVTISTTLTFALAARTGGRPFVFGGLALGFGLAAVLTGTETLRGGAAVLTAVSAGVLGVMATVPAVRFRGALREAVLALLIAAVGAIAVIGYRPVVSLERFDYLTLGLAFSLALILVYRLGAGFHGLGRRGLFVVLVGTTSLAVTMAYAEMLRRYGSQEMIDGIYDSVGWLRAHARAVPRPIQVLVGVPALVWGTHMRARRRQGWWVCAFGTAATVSVAGIMVNPATGWLEATLIVLYSLVPGALIGYLLIRLDLAFTGPRGRRARREEEAAAIRPEPRRWHALL
ncbi:hypothetical protein EKO23_02020 [Nocardioides guangzhouensis]|uniref:Uncharacterized protein n=2 Tax=Nocardioides guangzhouensis TaxID=2497878 RepID=A0A4Q4ZKA8_9ACTN|nr:hypothetical protein EKO23_02020 [Nocardioides guangzhouensis]